MVKELRITPLLLTADGEHKDRVKFCNVSIQRDITTRTVPDHKFSKVRLDRSTGLGFLALYPGIFRGFTFAQSCVIVSNMLVVAASVPSLLVVVATLVPLDDILRYFLRKLL